MASRAEQKAQARAAREERQRQITAAKQRRQRYTYLGGMLLVAIAAVVIAIAVSSSGGGSKKVKPSKSAEQTAIATVDSELAGIPQSGTTLGNPNAPVTINEWGDLVCPICDDFALSSEPQLIADEVKTGHVKLVWRGLETASGDANGSEYVTTQTAVRSAGLQNKAWYYILLAYEEQPATIGGQDAEKVAYITTAYLQNLASQVKGLDLAQWQANLTNKTLEADVAADRSAANANGITGTPGILVSKGSNSILWDRDNTESAVPTIQQLKQTIAQVS